MRRRRALRITGIVLACLVALIVAAVLLLHTPPARRYALNKVEGLLRGQNIDLKARNLSYNLAAGRITMDKVVVRSTLAPELPPIFTADHVEVNINLPKAVAGSYHVENAVVRNPAVRIVVTESGKSNIPQGPQTEEQKQQSDVPSYLISHAAVTGAAFSYEDRKQGLAAALPAWSVSIEGNPLTGNHEVRLNSEAPGRVEMRGRPDVVVRAIHLDGVLGQDSLDLRRLAVNAAGSSLNLAGRVEEFSDPSVDLRMTAGLDAATLRALAGVKQKIGGEVRVDATAQGRLAELVATATVTSRNLQYEELRPVTLDVRARYARPEQRVQLDGLSFTSPAGSGEASGTLSLEEAGGSSSIRAQLGGLDLARISRLLGSKTLIASRASAQVEGSWPAMRFEQAQGRARLQLAATSEHARRNVAPLSGMAVVQADRGRIVVALDGVQSLGARADGRVLVRNMQALAGQLRVYVANARELLASLNAFQGKQAAPPQVSGPVTVVADLGGTIHAPRVAARLDAPALSVGTMYGVTAGARVTYSPAQLAIQEASLHWRDQSVTAQGTVGLQGRRRPLDLTAQVESFAIPAALAVVGRPQMPVKGTVSATAKIGGTVENPAGTLAVNATGLEAYGEQFGTLVMNAELRNQLVRLQRFRLEKPAEKGPEFVNATGAYDLRSKAYTVDLSGDLRLRQFALQDGTAVRGAIKVAAKGSGTVENPALEAQVDADELTIRDQQVGSVDATLNLANRRGRAEVRVPDYNLNATAHMATTKPHATEFRVTANGTDLAKLPLPPEQRPQGRLTAVVEGRGSLDAWQSGTASVRVEPLDIVYKGQRIRSQGPIVAEFANRTLTVQQAQLLLPGSTLAIAGRMPLDTGATKPATPGDLRVNGSLDLGSVVALTATDPRMKAQGLLTLDARLTGSLKQLQPSANLSLRDGFFFSPALEPAVCNINLDVALDEGSLRVRQLAADWAEGHITAQGDVPLALLPAKLPFAIPAASTRATFTLDVDHLNLGAVGPVPENVKGFVSLRAQASAPDLRPQSVTGSLVFRQLSLQAGDVPIEQKGPSTITVADGVARVQRFLLTGPGTRFEAAGTAALIGTRALDLRLLGNLDLGVLTSFADGVTGRGPVQIEFAAAGTASNPDLRGFVQLTNAELAVTQPSLYATNLDLRLEMAGPRVTLAQLQGTLNGGALSGAGGLSFAGGLRDVDLRVGAKNVFMNAPEGFRTASDVDLRFRNQEQNLVLGGKVTLLEGAYTDPITLTGDVIRYLRAGDTVELTEERSPFLSRIRFDLGVETAQPVVIDNNLAKLEVTSDLKLIGDYYRPALSGRVMLAEGGQLTLNERRYVIDRGVITFVNQTRIEPSLDLLATTEASGYDITLRVGGEVGDTETTLTSDPPLAEPDIVSVLLTGRTLEEARGSQVDVAREQLLALLAGGATGEISAGLQRATGLSMVRVEPSLISSETEPTARLTVGQDLTRDLSLVYSLNLRNTDDQIYVAEYDVSRRFTARGVKQQDNTYRFEFRHDIKWGGPGDDPRQPQRDKPKVASLAFAGTTYFGERDLADKFDLEPGDEYDFFKVREGLDALEKMYQKRNLLEARFHVDRQAKGDSVNLLVKIDPGPALRFVYEGWQVPERARDVVREIWQRGVFDAQRLSESAQALRNALIAEGYLRPSVTYGVGHYRRLKQVTFDIEPGVRYHDVQLVFDSARGIKPEELREALEKADLLIELHNEPDKISTFLQRFYREYGFLDASVGPRRYDLDPKTGTGRVIVPVREGQLYRVRSVDFTGNYSVDVGRLRDAVLLMPGDIYKPDQRDRSYDKIQDLYLEAGFRNVEISPSLRKSPNGTVDVVFTIQENKQQVVQDIRINGTRETSPDLVNGQLAFKLGDVLNSTKLSESRRKLYRTGAFFVVDVDPEPMPRSGKLESWQQPVRVNVTVEELPAYEFHYGASFDTDRGPGGVLDISNRNSLGSARVVGFRTRADAVRQEDRLYFSQPQLTRFPLKTDAAIFFTREDREAFNTDRLGFTFQQESRWGNYYVYNFGYRFERTRSYDSADPALRFRTYVAPITASLTREKRDDMLDAHRGSFMSHAFEYGAGWLGSGLKFYRYFGQYSQYVPLSSPERLPYSGGVKKPRFVYAGSVRLGIAEGLAGQTLLPSERFFAGGGTTVRGFENDSLGPRDEAGRPLGGDAMFVINNELRFPIFNLLEGVGFVDIGNVYARASDFRPWDLRTSVGAGLRVRTPWVLLRLDYGLNTKPRPGEPRGRFFISIGQAF